MKILTVCVLGCAMMVLAGAAESKAENDLSVRSQLVKRSMSCPRGWRGINSRCFRYVPKAMSWAEAERNCESMGANLASVHNLEEYHEIQRLILKATHKYTEIWIGGTNAQQNNVWLWSDGKPFHYTNWCKGEPNNGHGWQHCIQMNFGDEKCWDDLGCNESRPSVCAKNKK